MLKIWSCEGEKVVVLTDVKEGLTTNEVADLVRHELNNEDMYDVYCDQVYEGWVVGSEGCEDLDVLPQLDVAHLTLKEYVKDFISWYKEWC